MLKTHRSITTSTIVAFLILQFSCFMKDDYRGEIYDPLPQIMYNFGFSHQLDSSIYQVQIMFTPISRDTAGRPVLEETFAWGLNDEYFYPASTVKMPVAALALQRLGELEIDANTPMINRAGRAPQSAALQDTTTASGLPNVAQYARKIFLHSDNDAYNRLYEWLGPEYINEQMREKGLDSSRIIHRLGVSGYDTLGNRWLNPVSFELEFRDSVYALPERYEYFYDDLGLSGQMRGRGYYDSELDEIVREPFDFRYRNYYHITDMHHTVGRLVVPEAYEESQRFGLSEADYKLLWRAMGQRPRESRSPVYDEPDNWVKFIMFADRDSSFQIPRNIRILNKVGLAYGYMTDAAYMVDLQTGVEFLLTATIHVNENEIYNDGQYEYEELGELFFSELGRYIYQSEMSRRERVELPQEDGLIKLLNGL